jgi:glycosyltransferase involved in cell wall biosynthesis
MAASRPAVVTDVGGAREAIADGETGYLVRSGDDLAMADRIISLLRDPDRMRAMGRRARQVVEQKFSSEARLANTVRLYDGLLARTAPAQAETVKEARREGA